MTINQDIVNDVICNYAKFYYEIICIAVYTKITKSVKLVDLKYSTYLDLDVPHYCVAQNTKYLNKIFCTLVR
jgi:hypothetical protein